MGTPAICLVAIDMGYGHLRAADALARVLGVPVLRLDEPPLATELEHRLWDLVRGGYEAVCRASQHGADNFFARALAAVTAIPPLDGAEVAAPNAGLRVLHAAMRLGVGRALAARLRQRGETLVTTFYSPALAADLAGVERAFCVVTDSDINRVWAPVDAAHTRIDYLAPSQRAARRIAAFGVPPNRIQITGFPLPDELLGGPDLPVARRLLEERKTRLSGRGEPPLVTFAVGGAGAQTDLVRAALPSLAAPLRAGRLRLALVAGIRAAVAQRFRGWLAEAGLQDLVEVLVTTDHESYFRRFNQLLSRTDLLWTKPSEMTFFAALGLPIIFAPPIGAHEQLNLEWAAGAGAGVAQGDPAAAAEWIAAGLADGSFAAMAQAGFDRLPNRGTYQIAAAVS